MAHGHLPSHPALRGLRAWPTCLGHWEISAATARHIVHPDPMSPLLGVEPHTPIPFPWKNQVSKIHKKYVTYVFVLFVFSMGEAVTHCYKEISSSRMPRPHYPWHRCVRRCSSREACEAVIAICLHVWWQGANGDRDQHLNSPKLTQTRTRTHKFDNYERIGFDPSPCANSSVPFASQ